MQIDQILANQLCCALTLCVVQSCGFVVQDLLIFSASSPLVAIITYAVMHWLTQASSSVTGVALCILFSAGTFLYAACVHLLPNVADTKTFTAGKMAVLAVSAVVPCLINGSHTHHH